MCPPTRELPIPGWASRADFLLAEIEEKEEKQVGLGGKHSPLIPGPGKGVPQGTSGMP